VPASVASVEWGNHEGDVMATFDCERCKRNASSWFDFQVSPHDPRRIRICQQCLSCLVTEGTRLEKLFGCELSEVDNKIMSWAMSCPFDTFTLPVAMPSSFGKAMRSFDVALGGYHPKRVDFLGDDIPPMPGTFSIPHAEMVALGQVTSIESVSFARGDAMYMDENGKFHKEAETIESVTLDVGDSMDTHGRIVKAEETAMMVAYREMMGMDAIDEPIIVKSTE
jgi:hypothetical protein